MVLLGPSLATKLTVNVKKTLQKQVQHHSGANNMSTSDDKSINQKQTAPELFDPSNLTSCSKDNLMAFVGKLYKMKKCDLKEEHITGESLIPWIGMKEHQKVQIR